MVYSGQDYEFLFGNTCGNLTEDAFEALRHQHVFRYRTWTIKSGDVLECEIFPIWNTKTETRAARENTTREAQRNLNDRNAKKNLRRKIDANFTRDDLHVTLTYKGGVLPDEARAKKDMRNFLRRIRDYRRKHGLPELKYVYVIEFADGDGRRKRVHHHVIMSGMDRKVIKSLWPHGSARADELEPEDGTLEGLSRYITKQPNKSKRWQTSRNLIEPKATYADTKISRRKVEMLAADMEAAAPQIFGKLFEEYDFDGCTVKNSDFVAGAYIYAKMHRKPPPREKAKRKG